MVGVKRIKMAKKKNQMFLIAVVLIFVLLISWLSYSGVINVGTSSVTSSTNCDSKPFLSLDGTHYLNFDQVRQTEKITFTDQQFLDNGFSVKSDGVYVCYK